MTDNLVANPWLGVVWAVMVLAWLYVAARLITYGITKSYFQARKEETNGN